MQRLGASPDGHFFQYADGSPFFYLADTAWMLPNKLTEEEACRLFADRAAKGFTVVQALVFRDLFEPNTAKADGIRPFASDADLQAARLNPAWIHYIVRLTQAAAEYDLIMGWLPTWGDKWNEHSNSAGPVIMDAAAARDYCRVLSDALGDCDNVIWILGGDSPIKTQEHADIVRAMAEGIRVGAGAERLISYHPAGGANSAIFHSEPWLDFNAQQSGHGQLNIPNYAGIADFYRTVPPKPCIDMEPNYEGMPVGFGRQNHLEPHHRAYFDDYDVRRSYYRSVLAGAAGFTYGCESIRQVFRPGDRCHAWDGRGILTWEDGLSAPASSQLKLLKELLLDRSYFTRVPAPELLLEHAGEGPLAYTSVARCRNGNYIIIYTPMRQMLTVDTSVIASSQFRVSIYDPETCTCACSWECKNDGRLHHIPSRRLDSLIVIDALS